MTTRPAAAQHLRDLAQLRRVRDRIDREYAQPLDVEALARGAHDQESRSAGPRAAASMTAMDITVHARFPPHDDPSTEVTANGATAKELTHDVGGGRPVTVTDPDGNVAGPLQDR